MKNLLPLLTVIVCLLTISRSQAAIEAQKPDSRSETTATDTTPEWIVQISPAPGVNSYATRETRFPLGPGPQAVATSPDSRDLIVIAPRVIPDVKSTAVITCDRCPGIRVPHSPVCRVSRPATCMVISSVPTGLVRLTVGIHSITTVTVPRSALVHCSFVGLVIMIACIIHESFPLDISSPDYRTFTRPWRLPHNWAYNPTLNVI